MFCLSDQEYSYFSLFPTVRSQVLCCTAPAVGQKDIIQPLGEGKVSAHVAHRSLAAPPGIVNKVKAQEKSLNRGCKRALSVKTAADRQEALSATAHM